ncbi:AEC family transporter [Neptuniibacter sp.]|uniref:AEC family transporter n=1 Tax=Neptuniibacter sp. TaxID=1962643 RepID=UPI0026278D19|nr:AEC family transporter [Neptuniibacter sp.]MCP4597651.1 AEC family transporter [Neptuniibacter sp.]
MQDITYILSLTSPTFILIAMGFLTVRFGFLQKDNVRTLAWFVVNFGLPAAMFKALSSRSFQDILHFDYLLIFGLGSLIAFSVMFALAKARGKPLTQCALFGLGGSMSNSLMIGFPIIMQLFGDAALVPFALTLIIENLFILPLTLALADTGEHKDSNFFKALFKSLPQLLKNPIIVSIALGIMSTAADLHPPAFVGRVIDMLSVTVGGVALFAIGGMLVGLQPKGMMTDISSIVFGKLIIHPLAVFVMILLFPPMPELFQQVAVILACMPMFSIYAVIGMRYNYGGLCSAVLLPTTILAFITINLVIWLLGVQ